jgi:tRNA(fMet)-specific endonuclease VapC
MNSAVRKPCKACAAAKAVDARAAGSVRAALEVSGKPIGAYDVLIAGQAIHGRSTLVTANVAELSRDWQDWAKP